VSLSYGVDDLDGTVIEEKIYHMAGAKTPQEMACGEMVKAIREAGREPVQRDSLYRPVAQKNGDGKLEDTELEGVVSGRDMSAASAYAGASNEGGAA